MNHIVLKGLPVSDAILQNTSDLVHSLTQKNVIPCLAVIRLGEKPDDLSYERTILRKAEAVGISVQQIVLNPSITQYEYESILDQLHADSSVHGILPLRPLPAMLNPFSAFEHIGSEKDVDGCSQKSLGILFTGSGACFAPCTAQAVMDVLRYYQIPIAGKKAVIVGRSLVVGKPLSQLLLDENATVTICHSKTSHLSEITRTADILIACIGKPEFITKDYLSKEQTVLDVGINWIASEQRLAGDVLFSDAAPFCHAITPVPGGIGMVTTARLLNNTALAAQSQCAEQ